MSPAFMGSRSRLMKLMNNKRPKTMHKALVVSAVLAPTPHIGRTDA
jgi:hypothetical protein